MLRGRVAALRYPPHRTLTDIFGCPSRLEKNAQNYLVKLMLAWYDFFVILDHFFTYAPVLAWPYFRPN